MIIVFQGYLCALLLDFDILKKVLCVHVCVNWNSSICLNKQYYLLTWCIMLYSYMMSLIICTCLLCSLRGKHIYHVPAGLVGDVDYVLAVCDPARSNSKV